MLLLGMSGHGRSLSLGLRPGCGMPWCGMPQRGLTGTRTGSPGSGRATGMTFSSRTFWELVESPQQAGSGGLSIWDAARFSRPLLPGGWRGCCVNRGLTAPWWVAGVLREQGVSLLPGGWWRLPTRGSHCSLPLQALLCSCFIPFYSGLIPPCFRGEVSLGAMPAWGRALYSLLGRYRTLPRRGHSSAFGIESQKPQRALECDSMQMMCAPAGCCVALGAMGRGVRLEWRCLVGRLGSRC